MRSRHLARLPVRPLYTLTELARAADINRARLRRLLEAYGIELLRVGDRLCVPLSEIATKLKPLWDSVLTSEEWRQEGDLERD